MAKAIRIHQTGGPEVLIYEDFDAPAPGKGEAAIRQTAIGVNFIDVYHRTGLYPQPTPFTLGSEAAGVVTAVGLVGRTAKAMLSKMADRSRSRAG